MTWRVSVVATTLLVAASQLSMAQISVDMNQITCGRYLGYSPEERDFVRFWMNGYYNAAANSSVLNYDLFQFRKDRAVLQENRSKNVTDRNPKASAYGSETIAGIPSR